MSPKPSRTPKVQPFVPRPEIPPMSFQLHRALDLAVSVLIVFLSLSTGAATAMLHG